MGKQLINCNGIKAEISNKTYRTSMYRSAIFSKMNAAMSKLSEELELPIGIVEGSLWQFGSMSARCKIIDGDIDFPFVQHNDSEQMVKDKFMAFIDSNYMPFIEAVCDAIDLMDKAQDSELAPPLNQDDGDDSKKK